MRWFAVPGKQDKLITLKTTVQARKQWTGLPDKLTVRLIRRKVNGVERQAVTSMTGALRYPAGMVRQEPWGILLTYNLVRYQMVKMAFSLKGDDLPYQPSFSGAVPEILRLLIGLPRASPGAIPGHLKHFYSNAEMLKLPPRREREYAREVREKRLKYPFKNNAGHLSDQH